MTMQPESYKTIIIDATSLFGYCDPDNITDAQKNVVNEWRANGARVVLTYGNDSWQADVGQIAFELDVDSMQNPFFKKNTVWEGSKKTLQQGSAADLLTQLHINGNDALFIANGESVVADMRQNGLNVYVASSVAAQKDPSVLQNIRKTGMDFIAAV